MRQGSLAALIALVIGVFLGVAGRPPTLRVVSDSSAEPMKRGPVCAEESIAAEAGCPQPLLSRGAPMRELAVGPICSAQSNNDLNYVAMPQADGGVDFRLPTDIFDFGILEGHHPNRLGDETIINGAAMRMATLEVPLPAEEVIYRYNNQLRANGIEVFYGELMGKNGPRYLTFRPINSNVRRTITVMPAGDRSTVVFSVGDPSHMLDHTAAIPEALPHPPDITGVAVDETREGSSRQTDVAFDWPQHAVEDAKQYYARELTKIGFQVQKAAWDVDKTDLCQQSFSRGGENLALTLKKTDDGVVISLLWVHT